jgi:hypothetical protein
LIFNLTAIRTFITRLSRLRAKMDGI